MGVHQRQLGVFYNNDTLKCCNPLFFAEMARNLILGLNQYTHSAAVCVLDTNGKKARFIEYAVRQLGVANVCVEQCRIEQYHPPDKFTTIVSRAFSSLEAFARVSQPLLRTEGCLLAMKGKLPKEEIEALNKAQWGVSSQPVDVPGLDAERHMVMLGPLG